MANRVIFKFTNESVNKEGYTLQLDGVEGYAVRGEERIYLGDLYHDGLVTNDAKLDGDKYDYIKGELGKFIAEERVC